MLVGKSRHKLFSLAQAHCKFVFNFMCTLEFVYEYIYLLVHNIMAYKWDAVSHAKK